MHQIVKHLVSAQSDKSNINRIFGNFKGMMLISDRRKVLMVHSDASLLANGTLLTLQKPRPSFLELNSLSNMWDVFCFGHLNFRLKYL